MGWGGSNHVVGGGSKNEVIKMPQIIRTRVSEVCPGCCQIVTK